MDTSVRPSQAACATAARAVTMSARIPSTSKDAHTSAIWRSTSSPTRTEGSRALAAWIRSASAASDSAKPAAKASGSAS